MYWGTAHVIAEDAKEVGVGAISEPGRCRRAVSESGKGMRGEVTGGIRGHWISTAGYVWMILLLLWS